jgi:acetyl-CoA C-acetyltransferase
MADAFIYDGIRTPFGRHAGALASVRPDELLARTIRALMARSHTPPELVEDVVIGCTNQAGEDCRNVARRSALLADLPIDVAAITVNRLCGSGLAAVVDAARAVGAGQGEVFVAGGVESMSRAPFALAKAETPYSREARIYDTTIGSRFPHARFDERFGTDTMPETADNVGRDLGIGRQESDVFAAASQRKYAEARAAGFFDDEIVAVEVCGRKPTDTVRVSQDEHPRPDSSLEKLARLPPLQKGGVVTAGNASGVNDGAAALIVSSARFGERTGARPLARIVSAAVAGVEPRVMGLGPVPALRKALGRAGLEWRDIDIIEINEAFATQVLGCLKLLGIDFEDSRVNPNGGAIAIGHPLGASGARLALTTARQLQRSQGRYAAVSMCIGVGQGIAAILERC